MKNHKKPIKKAVRKRHSKKKNLLVSSFFVEASFILCSIDNLPAPKQPELLNWIFEAYELKPTQEWLKKLSELTGL